MKGPVILRRRLLPSGNTTLYLDIYVEGKRHTEALGLSLIPERTRADKARNEDTLRIAETVAAKRLVEVSEGKFGIGSLKAGTQFFPWLEAYARDKAGKLSASRTAFIDLTARNLRDFCPDDNLTFRAIDKEWCRRFSRWLQGHDKWSENYCKQLWDCFASILHAAVEAEVIQSAPTDGQHPFRATPGKRMYLTIDELRRLAETPCRKPEVKRLFLFSCLTGLRWSDVIRLTWDQVVDDGSRIIFKQQKTGGLQYLDISAQARELMGERSEGLVFKGHPQKEWTRDTMIEWTKAAGIDKHITFHCARHTFATLQLSLGTDIYTVSKLLGHASVATTQIYAKVMDERKREAVERIPKIF